MNFKSTKYLPTYVRNEQVHCRWVGEWVNKQANKQMNYCSEGLVT